VRCSCAVALLVLAWLLVCPLASSGLFASCHDDEAAMDCCKEQDSPKVPAPPLVTALPTPTVAPAPSAAPAVIAAVPAESNSARLERLRVFRL
jgi:hypothetical protein